MFKEFRKLWRLITRIVLITGVALSFFAVMELLRAFQTLYAVQPWLGYAFLAVLSALVIWAVIYFTSAFSTIPRALKPPAREKPKKFGKYLHKYLKRLHENEHLDSDGKLLVSTGIRQIEAAFNNGSDESLSNTIRIIENETIEPVLKILDTRAEQKIRAGVRDIMFAVTLSPYRSVDLLVVIFRNLQMVKNIAVVYNSRPAPKESIQIIVDTCRVVAAVNFLNLGSKMIENITKGLPGIIPGVSRIVDDCAEGLAAGLLSSVTGHAAKDRCRAYQRWDYQQARDHIARHLKTFTSDVGKMFFQDVIPHVKLPGTITLEKWRELRDNVARGFNETVHSIHNFVRTRTWLL